MDGATPEGEPPGELELEAKDAVRRRSWRPFPRGELLRLVDDERARSVVTPSGLLEVLVSALSLIQADLTAVETPGVLFLWNELPDGAVRPKSEPSVSNSRFSGWMR